MKKRRGDRERWPGGVFNWKGVDIYCVLIDKGISGVAPCKCVIVRWMKDIVVMVPPGMWDLRYVDQFFLNKL